MKKLLSENEEIFNFFTGKWKIERKISNYNKDENISKMHGLVTFSRQSDHYTLYQEEVQTNFTTGLTTTGIQTYLFELSESRILQYRFNPNNKQDKTSFSIKHPDTIKMYELEFIPSAGIILASGTHACLINMMSPTLFIRKIRFVQSII